jgi:site-specific recombinase XerD
MKKYWEITKQLPNGDNYIVINQFLLSLNNANRKKSTLIAYRKVLQSFFKEVEARFSSLTINEIQHRLNEHPKNLKKKTIRNYRHAIRSFYNFCVEKNYIENSPFQNVGCNYWEVKGQLPNEENQKMVNEYLLSLKNSNSTKRTISVYRRNLELFFKEREKQFSTLTPNEVHQWISEHKKDLNKATIQIYLCYLRSFYNFCVEEGYIRNNPVAFQWEKKDKYWELSISLSNEENKERINEYLLSLYVTNYSKCTISMYRYILQSFFKERKELFSSIASADIQQWLALIQMRKKERTIKFYLNALNSFYRYCVEEGLMEKVPLKKRWNPRLPKPTPKYLNKEEVAKVRKQGEKETLRDRVLVEFLLTSGCRVGEVYSLNRAEVDLENRIAMVTGKGNKVRQVHFTVKCALLLEHYLETRKDEEPALFTTNKGKPRRLSINWMYRIIKRIGNRVGLSGTLHPHRLRHTFATDLLQKGAELSFIGDELGHTHLQTTQIYANLPKQKIITLYRKYMG